MDPKLPAGVMDFDAPADPDKSHRALAGETIAHRPGPKPLLNAIARIAAVSSDQMSVTRLLGLLLFKMQYFILRTVYSPRPPQTSRLLNLGCGDSYFEGWVNADRVRVIYLLSKAQQVWRGTLRLPGWVLNVAARWKCPDDYWEGIFTEHLLEHLSYKDGVIALREALRTLRPGSWIRVLLPDLGRYVEFYNGSDANGRFREQFAYGAEAIAYLTQNQGHASVWDAKLLSAVLAEIGFTNVATVDFGCGTDRRLMMDNPGRRHESLYVEEQKPPRN